MIWLGLLSLSLLPYLTLRCLNDYKMHLNTMFTSKQWRSSRFSRIEEGKQIQNCVLDIRFWYYVIICIKIIYFLVKVLWLVDSDKKPAMSFIYEAMDQVKDKIQVNFGFVKKRYWLSILLIIYLLLWVDT